MKTQKTFTIDLEVFIKLKEKGINCSELINNYLKQFLDLKEDNTGKRINTLKLEITKTEADLLNKKQLIKEIEEKNIKQFGIPFTPQKY